MFEFDSLDARPVSSGAMMGKPAGLEFGTTYDPMSQLDLYQLLAIAQDMPNVGFALVAHQDPSARELGELYRDTMKVTFPVALGDAASIAGGGSLGDVHHVPTVVVLRPDGRVLWRHAGHGPRRRAPRLASSAVYDRCTVILFMRTGVRGRSSPSVGVVSIFFSTSIPDVTFPNTGCLESPGENQSRNELWTVLMKN